jgi:Putative auto-transporter adhesin, head GIN domain
MKRFLLLTGLSALSVWTFGQNQKLIADKNAASRNVRGFHAIDVSSGIDLYLSQGNEAVAVSASDVEYRDKIRTEVDNGVLKIYLEHSWQNWNWGNHKLKAYVSFATIDALVASGGSDVYGEGVFKLTKLDINLSGGSDLKDVKLEVTDLRVKQSGGSDSYLSGTASNLKVEASGGSDLHGYDLITDNCSISASGGSDTHITVNKELNVSTSGGSDVYYKGGAVIRELRSSGSSSVSKKG